jgi:hypothetical protein
MFEKTTSRLEKRSSRLFDVMKESPDRWFNRSELAKAIDKRKLSAYDIAMLEILQARGLIQIEFRDNRTPIGFEFVYRLAEGA